MVFETDSKKVIQEFEKEQRGSSVICTIKEILQHDWTIHLIHVFREGNKVTNGLTKMTFSRSLCNVIFVQSPDEIL